MELEASRPVGGLSKVIRVLDKVGVFSRWTNMIGLAIFVIIIGFTFTDVILRYLFNSPVPNGTLVVELMMIVAVFFALAHTQNEKAHVSIDVITARLKPRARLTLESITHLLSLVTLGLVIWQVLLEIPWVIENNIVHSQAWGINKGPFLVIIAIGCTCLDLLILRDFLVKIRELSHMGVSRSHWLLVFGIPLLLAGLAVVWIQSDFFDLSLPVVGMLGIAVSLLLFLSGMPIAFALILVSVVFVAHIKGGETALGLLRTEPYRNVGSYNWSVMAFFILMGYFCFYARFGQDLYKAANRWFGHFRGGLAMATVGACGGLAAIVGDTISCVATMSAIALPEMRRYGYNDRLSTGSIACGATLGPIIPPSVPFIVYGLLTRESIGDLFMGGIVPGILIMLAFFVVIAVWCRRNPAIGPAAARSTWLQRVSTLKSGGPILILFLIVIGGIYQGIFTPTEGGAIGAFGAIVLGLVWRRLGRRSFSLALLDSGKVISMIFIMLVGAAVFTKFMVWCNLTATISNFFHGLGWTPILIVILIELIFFALGFVVDTLVLTLIGVPIVHPVAVALGFDPVWFGVLTVVVMNLGTITPPVALNLFVLKGLNKEIPIETIFSGALPFVITTIAAVILMFAFPSIITWLPNALK